MGWTTQADRLDAKIAGVCMIASPLLMAPTTAFEYSKGTLFWAGAIGVLVYAMLVPGLLGVARILREPMPRVSVVAGLMSTLGCVAGATFQAALLHEWAARKAGASEAMMTAITDVTHERVFPILIIFGILFPISLLTISVGLFRTSVVPTWVAVLLGIGAILFPVGHIGGIQVLQHTGDSVLLIPMAWFGLYLFTGARSTSIVIPVTA